MNCAVSLNLKLNIEGREGKGETLLGRGRKGRGKHRWTREGREGGNTDGREKEGKGETQMGRRRKGRGKHRWAGGGREGGNTDGLEKEGKGKPRWTGEGREGGNPVGREKVISNEYWQARI